MKIRWTTEAHDDLINILTWARERNVLEASNIAERIERAERTIETFPKAAYYNKAGDYYERTVPRTRVILIYRLVDDMAVIIAAFHTSQDPASKP